MSANPGQGSPDARHHHVRAGDVRVEDVRDPFIVDPTDVIVRVKSACICGSDLWPYADMAPSERGRAMGHEAIGVVEDVGADVCTLKTGDLVVMPLASSDGNCEFCHDGLHRVGVPHYPAIPLARPMFYENVIVGGGPAPVRAYIEELLPDILDGKIEPGRGFDRSVALDGVPDGYRAMAACEAIKVVVRP